MAPHVVTNRRQDARFVCVGPAHLQELVELSGALVLEKPLQKPLVFGHQSQEIELNMNSALHQMDEAAGPGWP